MEESSESLRKVKGRSVSGTSFSIETEHRRELFLIGREKRRVERLGGV